MPSAAMPTEDCLHSPLERVGPNPVMTAFLVEMARQRAEAAWAWFVVFNPLNIWVTVPPEFEEECSESTIEAASRWEVQRMFLWHLGLERSPDAMGVMPRCRRT